MRIIYYNVYICAFVNWIRAELDNNIINGSYAFILFHIIFKNNFFTINYTCRQFHPFIVNLLSFVAFKANLAILYQITP